MKSIRHRTVWLLLLVVLFLSVSSTAFAAPDDGPVARWPFLLASLGLMTAGLAAMDLRRAFFELSPFRRIWRIVGIACVSLGVFGSLFSLTAIPPGGSSIEWVESLQEGQERARELNRPLMVDFTADWCIACQELEAEVFLAPEVRHRLETEFVAVKIDYDKGDEDTIRAIERYQVTGLPRVAFETPEGEFLRGPSFDGKVSIGDFQERLDHVLAGANAEVGSWMERTLGERGLLVLFLLVFGAGILASLSPCIYPLIPITIGVFGARQAATKREGFLLSLAYVGGIVATYSVLGISAALLGTLFGGFFQHLGFQIFLALTFILLGLGCLGVFEIKLPAALQKRISEAGGVGKKGAFVMGLAAGILAVPCIGPVVAGILVYVAEQGDVMLGWSLLTVFAMGMGLLFLVLGTFSSLIHRLPRAGGWMEGIKALFGALFIGVGIFYLRLVLPQINEVSAAIWLWLAQ